MKHFTVENIDLEDFGDFLGRAETSFNIKFAANELTNITNFEKFFDPIADKREYQRLYEPTGIL